MKTPCVYILASKPFGTLYIGVTSNLVQRVWQHKQSLVEGFTKQYDVRRLVWYEPHESMESAIGREKAIKKWNREWKIRLIEEGNPDLGGSLPRDCVRWIAAFGVLCTSPNQAGEPPDYTTHREVQ